MYKFATVDNFSHFYICLIVIEINLKYFITESDWINEKGGRKRSGEIIAIVKFSATEQVLIRT